MTIQKIIIFAITLCIPIAVLIVLNKKSLIKSRSILFYNLAWLVFSLSYPLSELMQNSFFATHITRIFYFVVGFMTTESAMVITLGKKQEPEVKSKRRSVMQKVPMLGAFIYLTIINEIGITAISWFHWASHLSILIVIYLTKDLKGFYLYSIGTLILSFYYIVDSAHALKGFYPVIYSIVTVFVTMAMLSSIKNYEEQNNSLTN